MVQNGVRAAVREVPGLLDDAGRYGWHTSRVFTRDSGHHVLSHAAPLTSNASFVSRYPVSNSGVPCRGKFRRDVTTATRPLPLQPSGKLLNQTPFILEENKFQTSHTEPPTGPVSG